MTTPTRHEALDAITADGVVPIFNSGETAVARNVARCVAAGGLSTIEFTVRGAGAIDVAADLMRWAHVELPDLRVGVGSIVDAATAGRVVELGASFVFAPSSSAAVAAVCRQGDVPYVPGCGTVTEIQTAYEWGCDLVKLFPADSVGGPPFLREVRAPCPWVEAIPTGGIEPTADSMGAWFEAGAAAVGIGSALFPKDAVADQDWKRLERNVASAAAAATEMRR